MSEERDLQEFAQSIREVHDRFVEATEPHRPALWDYCLRLTGSPWDAEDLVQETMLRAFARLSHVWQPLRDGRAYLFRIASNTWIDSLRRASTRSALEVDLPVELPGAAEAPDAEARVEAGEALAWMVALLPPRQRVALLLADVFGFRNREVGAMIGVSEGAVKSLLHRARATLRGHGTRADAPAPAQATSPAAGPESDVESAVLARFVDAFNRRDAAALLALLDADASAEIVGAAEELGREVIAGQSLAEAMADPIPQEAEATVLFGEPVVCIYRVDAGRPRSLMWLIRLEVSEGRICRWTSYFFTPELIRHAAGALDVPAAPAGYRYVAG